MRAGGGTVQEALTAEAASVVKQAETLARRRGHAQVTPLHVANTMLAASSGILRTACLQSHSHPLQCKALELCFNVALNRLPASTASPILGTHYLQYPSISNALVAAFKRAQAHQRRGSIENQQQPLLAVKIDLEQLIISILDDPSVSRVMREAGFSSTHVKSNVEQAVSSEMCSQSTPSSVISKAEESNFIDLSHQSQPSLNLAGIKATKPKNLDPIRDEDIGNVIDNLMEKRRRSIVVVGERLSAIESVVQGVIDKILKGDVPEALREVKFLTLSGSYFRHLSRVEVEQKLEELTVHVRNYMGKGIVLNLGDLKWVTEYRFSSSSDKRSPYFCPMEHMIMELGKLACREGDNNGRIWLMGIATFQTYLKCKSRYPSLESLWGIHQITIPADSLSLSLITDSDLESQSTSRKAEKRSGWNILENDEDKQLTCCSDCSPKFEIETRSFWSSSTSRSDSTSSTLPVWLQQYQVENNFNSTDDDKDCVSIKDLCGRWNSICSSIHQRPSSSEKALTVASVSPSSSSTSGFSYEQQCTNLHQNHLDWPMLEAKQSWRDPHFWISTDTNTSESMIDPSLRLYFPEHKDHLKRLPFGLDPKSAPSSTSSVDVIEKEKLHQFKELNAENLKVLCNALENKVPWQRDIIPEVASTILQCRSGMLRRKGKVRSKEAKEETWLLFQGVDVDAKEKIAKELAKLVFGSHSNYVSIPLSNFSSPRADLREDCRNKRSRDDQSCSFIERFAEAVSINPHRVFLLEDVEQADYCSQIGFKKAIESGRIVSSNGEEVGLSDAIAILSCESFSSRSRACSPINQKADRSSKEDKVSGAFMDETRPFVSLDLNISIDDDRSAEDESIHDIGLVEYVDRQITFKIQQV